MLSREERAAYEHILGEMARHVDQFITPITAALTDDQGLPVGSGTYLEINGGNYLVTNEHVARWRQLYGLSHLPQRDHYHRRFPDMAAVEFPIDLAVAKLDTASCENATQVPLPIDRFDDTYNPVEGEIVLACGYPSYPRRGITEEEIRQPYGVHFGVLSQPAVSVLTYPILSPARFPQGLDQRFHALVNYEGMAFRVGEELRETPDPSGMSGCLLWDTKFIATGGVDWTPEMAKVCGQVNRWNEDEGLLVATKVQWLRTSLLWTIRQEAAFLNWIERGQPLWDDMVDWTLAEHSIPRLLP